MKNYDKITGFADEIDDSLTKQLEGLKALNMHYVEMRGVDRNNLIYHSDEKLSEISKRLEAADIAISAIGSPIGKIDIGDPFEPHMDDFKRAVEIAEKLNIRYIRLFSFYIPGNIDEPGLEERVFERIGKFTEYVKSSNVCLLHENEKGIFGASAEGCRRLMDNFFGEHFKAIFDFANFVQVGQDTVAAFELLKDYIAYIHVKDAVSATGRVVPAGCGDGHVAKILKALFERGFDGFLSLEPHLSDFKGFSELEKDGHHIEHEDGEPLSGFEAFKAAYQALIDINIT